MNTATDDQTLAGIRFDFLMPGASVFTTTDIAHALSHICRFTGHTRDFYSVAQHSVLVSTIVPPAFALAGLLHDASRAFIGDLARPLKQLLPEYQAVERHVQSAVFERFGLPATVPAAVQDADLVMLATERRDLLQSSEGWEWTSIADIEPLPWRIRPEPPLVARRQFLDRYRELIGVAIAGDTSPDVGRRNPRRLTPNRRATGSCRD